jgi:predicted PhzF superfamily epimerase YddE/YHI9
MTLAKSYAYAVVNVFTTEPLSGNSLAVFPDASEFDPEMMQKIARELNRWHGLCAFAKRNRFEQLPRVPA